MIMNTCPNAENCPIFTGLLSDKVMTSKSYKRQYCEAGEEKWSTCKRYLVKQKYGKCPPDLLPNSMKSVEDIGMKYNL